MNKDQILNEIDDMIRKSKEKGALTNEENQFFAALKKRTEDVDEFFARMVKNAGIKK